MGEWRLGKSRRNQYQRVKQNLCGEHQTSKRKLLTTVVKAPFYKNQNKMKGYNVIIETGEMIVSDFIIEAENLKEANKIAQSHKRLERKGRTRVKRIK